MLLVVLSNCNESPLKASVVRTQMQFYLQVIQNTNIIQTETWLEQTWLDSNLTWHEQTWLDLTHWQWFTTSIHDKEQGNDMATYSKQSGSHDK